MLYALDDSGLHFSAGRASLPALARDDPSGYLGIVATNLGTLFKNVVNPEKGRVLAWLLLPLPVWLVAVLGAWRHRRTRVVKLLLVVMALPVLTGLAFFLQPRYLVVPAALATVLVGPAVMTLRPQLRRPVVVCVLALLLLSSLQAFRGPAGWWHPADHSDQRLAGEWIAAHSDAGDRVMTRSMVVEYYAQRSTIAIPYAELDEVLRFARHYGAQYLVVDWYTVVRLRPQLTALREDDRVSGLRLVHEVRAEGRTTRIFALDPAPPLTSEIGPSLGFMGDG